MEQTTTRTNDQQSVNTNPKFIKDAFRKVKFGSTFDNDLDIGMKNGDLSIKFDPAQIAFDMSKGKVVEYLPRVIKDQTREDPFYSMKGYTGTLKENGKEPVSAYFSMFKMTGVPADKAYNALDGRFPKVTEMMDGVATTVVLRVNTDRPKNDYGNYSVSKAKLQDLDYNTVVTLGNVPLYSKEQDIKETIIKQLDNGDITPAYLRTSSGAQKSFLVGLPYEGAIALVNAKGEAIKNEQGEDIKYYTKPSMGMMTKVVGENNGMSQGDATGQNNGNGQNGAATQGNATKSGEKTRAQEIADKALAAKADNSSTKKKH